MLSRLTIGGFQGFAEDMSIRLAPLTLIFGPNGSGKSSILRAVRLIQQSMQGNISSRRNNMFAFEGDIVSLVSFANVVHQHNVSDAVTLGLAVSDFSGLSDRANGLSNLLEQVEVTWEVGNPGVLNSVDLRFIFKKSLGVMSWNFVTEDRGLTLNSFDNVELLNEVAAAQSRVGMHYSPLFPELEDEFETDRESYFVSSNDDSWDEVLRDCSFQLRGIFPNLAFQKKDSVAKKQAQLVSDVLSFVRISFAKNVTATQFVGPLRNIAERINFDASNQPFSDSDPKDAQDEIRANQVVSTWLNRLTGGRYDYRSVNYRPDEVNFLGDLRSELIIDNLTNTPVTFGDVGVGLSQVLPILQSLNTANRRLVASQAPILIEQPELHLHPRMQGDLMELFVEVSGASSKIQIIAETHSEAMLLRLQKLLRDGKLSPDKVSVVYVDQVDKTNFLSNIPLSNANDFEVQLPVSFAGLRLKDLL